MNITSTQNSSTAFPGILFANITGFSNITITNFTNSIEFTTETTQAPSCNCVNKSGAFVMIMFCIIIAFTLLCCLCKCMCNICYECSEKCKSCWTECSLFSKCRRNDLYIHTNYDSDSVESYDGNEEPFDYNNNNNYQANESRYGRIRGYVIDSDPVNSYYSGDDSYDDDSYDDNSYDNDITNIINKTTTDVSKFFKVLGNNDYTELSKVSYICEPTLCETKKVTGDFIINIYDVPDNYLCQTCPSATTESNSNADDEHTCTICLNSIVANDEHNENVKLVNCNHKFHTSCITKWFQNEKLNCPVCRYEYH